ncbi:DUF3291 domain-containing protein [Yinghuangia sp. YIM S09857]|uniref:DUF3291 domain-containing protein n=1 Tax=Yinghuangia sp. YIM S09857 TaxID=3436929 RepID=UPI003F536565
MPTLNWISPQAPPPDMRLFVMASRFELTSLTHVPAFLAKSMASWRQVKNAPGAYSASLIAQPFRRVFHTLSVWHDRDTLHRYANSDPHAAATQAMRPAMKSFTHAFWHTTPADLPVTWHDAIQRLSDQPGTERRGQ